MRQRRSSGMSLCRLSPVSEVPRHGGGAPGEGHVQSQLQVHQRQPDADVTPAPPPAPPSWAPPPPLRHPPLPLRRHPRCPGQGLSVPPPPCSPPPFMVVVVVPTAAVAQLGSSTEREQQEAGGPLVDGGGECLRAPPSPPTDWMVSLRLRRRVLASPPGSSGSGDTPTDIISTFTLTAPKGLLQVFAWWPFTSEARVETSPGP